jgi:glycosyltransferase involved in cell wall biosynthesis
MKTLTVFTPAYNRAHTIGRTYHSLCVQTSHDFEWLVVDDGSTDDTKELITSYLTNIEYVDDCELYGYSFDAPWLKVHYIYQENQGMHGAHNTAYDLIQTQLNTCIDSDDYMPDDAVEKILNLWNSLSNERKNTCAGIIALDVDDKNLKVIGYELPTDRKSTTLSGYYERGGKGDKKLIYRTEVIKSTPRYPIFEGEKYVGLGYKYRLIDQQYELLILNEPVCIVDYQLDGSSHSMYKQYWNNPRGWAFSRKNEMQYTKSLKRKLLVCAHYVSSCIGFKNIHFLSESPCKFLTFLSIPLGVVMHFYIKYKVKNNAIFKM